MSSIGQITLVLFATVQLRWAAISSGGFWQLFLKKLFATISGTFLVWKSFSTNDWQFSYDLEVQLYQVWPDQYGVCFSAFEPLWHILGHLLCRGIWTGQYSHIEETSQELQMLSPSLLIQGPQCNC